MPAKIDDLIPNAKQIQKEAALKRPKRPKTTPSEGRPQKPKSKN
jgi:hypothetical protein